ncbi:MAG: hypothetical protein ACE5HO_17700 [bacterium]
MFQLQVYRRLPEDMNPFFSLLCSLHESRERRQGQERQLISTLFENKNLQLLVESESPLIKALDPIIHHLKLQFLRHTKHHNRVEPSISSHTDLRWQPTLRLKNKQPCRCGQISRYK